MNIGFSIIIPCYNSAPYIGETLKSLSNQSYRNFEVIVVDDGSQDESINVAGRALATTSLNCRVISRPVHIEKGVAACRNYGVSLSNFDWVCFLDSDDLFHEDKLLLTADAISKYGNECLAYHSAAVVFEDETGKIRNNTCLDISDVPQNIAETLCKKNIIVTSTVTVNKELFQKTGGFDTALHGVEDYMMWLRLGKRTSWCYLNQCLTKYRLRALSLMKGRKMKYYVNQNTLLYSSALRTNEFSSSELNKIENYLFPDSMGYYSQKSINNNGWGDFLIGLFHIAQTGRVGLARDLLFRHTKNLLLRKVSELVRQK